MKVKPHIRRCGCGRLCICDEDWNEHKQKCKEEVFQDGGEKSIDMSRQVGFQILANERGYEFVT